MPLRKSLLAMREGWMGLNDIKKTYPYQFSRWKKKHPLAPLQRAYKGRFFGPNPSDSPSLTGKGRVGTQAIGEFPLPASGRG
jgi:hypothetical protein